MKQSFNVVLTMGCLYFLITSTIIAIVFNSYWSTISTVQAFVYLTGWSLGLTLICLFISVVVLKWGYEYEVEKTKVED